MAVIYKGAKYKIAGVVRHGERMNEQQQQSIQLSTFENGDAISEGLAGYFSREFTTYTMTMGNAGSASVDTVSGELLGTAAGAAGNFYYEFTVVGANEEETETITFYYEVVPVKGLQVDYRVDYDTYTSVFEPRWPEGVERRYIGQGGNPGIMVFEDQMILDGAYQPGAQDDYIWAGTLPDGFQISETGLVTGEVLVEVENPDVEMGEWELTVTSTFGDTATLTVYIEAHATI